MNAAEYCRVKAAPPGSNLYYSALFQSPDTKWALFALFAFHYEIHEAILTTSDPGVTRIKLQWWRDELQRLSKHHLNHPISRQLRTVMEKFGTDISSLVHYMDATERLINSPSGTSIHDWMQNYCNGVEPFWHCTGKIANCQQPESFTTNARSGGLIMLFEIMQNLRPLLAKGFNPLPDELTGKNGVKKMNMFSNPGPGALGEMFAGIVDHLAAGLDDCHERYPDNERKKLLFALIMNRLTAACCKEIRADGYRLLDHRISLTPIRKLWIASLTKLFL